MTSSGTCRATRTWTARPRSTEIENEQFAGSPELRVDRLVEEGDTVVAIGEGAGALRTGGAFCFAFCTVFTFASEKIRRVESYIVRLEPA
jgi:ketosteroid isomerase-like protein